MLYDQLGDNWILLRKIKNLMYLIIYLLNIKRDLSNYISSHAKIISNC